MIKTITALYFRKHEDRGLQVRQQILWILTVGTIIQAGILLSAVI